MSSHHPSSQLPLKVREKLLEVRRLLRRYVTRQTCLLSLCWLLAVFWLGAAIDYLPVRMGSSETPKEFRIALLCAMGLGVFWLLLRWMLPRLLTPVRDRSLALLIERQHPELRNELVTAVELCERSDNDVSNPNAHRAMLTQMLASVEQRMGSIAIEPLFNWQPLWMSGTILALSSLLTLGVAVSSPQWFMLWSSRLLTLSDTPWPRMAGLRSDGVQLQFPAFTGQLTSERVLIPFDDTQTARIASGASALLKISADAEARQIPEICTLYYRSDDGSRGRANLRRVGGPENGWQQFHLDGPPLDGMLQSMSLDVIGLDARLRDLRLEVVEPIVITELQLQCVYPEYLLDSLSSRARQEVLNYRVGMRIPEGTELSLMGTSSHALQSVQYTVRATGESGETSEFGILTAEPEGASFRIALGHLSESQLVEIRLLDQFGLSSPEVMRYVITIQEDEIPQVESRLEGIGVAVTPNAVLPVRGVVSDDHGIDQVFVDLTCNENTLPPISLELIDGQIQSSVDLTSLRESGQLIAEPGETLGLIVSAKDRYDLNETPHLGKGQPLQLSVVTPDQLLVVLDRQELELRQRLELVISELNDLDRALKDLAEQLGTSDVDLTLGSIRDLGSVVFLQESADSEGIEQDSQEVNRLKRQRMAILKAQQGQLQADKSEQELSGIANRIDNLRQQLINNRIDSLDRQVRLQEKVFLPLNELLASHYAELNRSMHALQSSALAGEGLEQTNSALDALARVLAELEMIKASMLDIESFNEIIDLVRLLLDQQEELLEQTEAQQKSRILDLLK